MEISYNQTNNKISEDKQGELLMSLDLAPNTHDETADPQNDAEFDRRREVGNLLLPAHLLPETFGLTWDMSREAVLGRLSDVPVTHQVEWIAFDWTILGLLRSVALYFDEAGLRSI